MVPLRRAQAAASGSMPETGCVASRSRTPAAPSDGPGSNGSQAKVDLELTSLRKRVVSERSSGNGTKSGASGPSRGWALMQLGGWAAALGGEPTAEQGNTNVDWEHLRYQHTQVGARRTPERTADARGKARWPRQVPPGAFVGGMNRQCTTPIIARRRRDQEWSGPRA
jgi:hypothetical protein